MDILMAGNLLVEYILNLLKGIILMLGKRPILQKSRCYKKPVNELL